MLRFLPLATTLCLATTTLAEPSAKVVEGKVVVSGVKSSRDLRVVVAEGTEKDIAARPQVGGEWSYAEGKATFSPKYPFEPGTKYRVTSGKWKHDFLIPRDKVSEPTKIVCVLPETTEIPENILRFYIEFNQPMPRGDVYRYVTIHKEDGTKVVQPFVELDNELWNVEQTRLTLLIDPGRIKKEVKPRIDLGPVFERGKKYTMVISGQWPTLDGGTLGNDLKKPLSVNPPLSTAIDPKRWKLTPPANGQSTLTITFDRPMDQPILTRSLTVLDPDGKKLPGKIGSTDKHGWKFRPTARWQPGKYKLRIDTVLEDVCGNRIDKPFEVDLLRPAPKEFQAEYVDLPFNVGER